MPLRQLELLAPARNADIGIEAIRHGADAVYIGGPAFGARQAACNSVDDIKRLAAYAHQFRAKVYVTVNTLLRESERPCVRELIWQLYDAGVAAIIVQDPAILDMDLPPIALHASTQMDNSTAERVRELCEAGFEQVVLARELDAGQIADIHRQVPEAALEVFVHGALCVGLSGRCHASERLLGRSADRGECAQVCRLRYDLENQRGERLVSGRYLLSLRDMNRSAMLESLIDAGATSFKIEGRLKDMAYVKNITAYYRQLLDSIIGRRSNELCRASIGEETFAFTPDPERSFNRGFTTYTGTDTQAQPLTPKAVGQPVGRVLAVGRDYIEMSGSFVAGDGLCYFDSRGGLQGFRVNRVEGCRLFPRPMPAGLRSGVEMFRSQDHAFDRLLAGPTAERRIPISIYIEEAEGGFRLGAAGVALTVRWPHEEARSDQRDNIVRQFSRLGDTVYRAESVMVRFTANWFIPSSVLAEWRRRLIALIDESERPADKPTDKPAVRRSSGVTIERDDDDLLMICRRHCVRGELGMCLRKEGASGRSDSLFLVMDDGRRLRLEFDCKKCEMRIYK